MTINRRDKLRFVECDGGDCDAMLPLVGDESEPPSRWYTRPANPPIWATDSHFCPECLDRIVELIRRT